MNEFWNCFRSKLTESDEEFGAVADAARHLFILIRNQSGCRQVTSHPSQNLISNKWLFLIYLSFLLLWYWRLWIVIDRRLGLRQVRSLLCEYLTRFGLYLALSWPLNMYAHYALLNKTLWQWYHWWTNYWLNVKFHYCGVWWVEDCHVTVDVINTLTQSPTKSSSVDPVQMRTCRKLNVECFKRSPTWTSKRLNVWPNSTSLVLPIGSILPHLSLWHNDNLLGVLELELRQELWTFPLLQNSKF